MLRGGAHPEGGLETGGVDEAAVGLRLGRQQLAVLIGRPLKVIIPLHVREISPPADNLRTEDWDYGTRTGITTALDRRIRNGAFTVRLMFIQQML